MKLAIKLLNKFLWLICYTLYFGMALVSFCLIISSYSDIWLCMLGIVLLCFCLFNIYEMLFLGTKVHDFFLRITGRYELYNDD